MSATGSTKQRPIIFGAPMVNAILRGEKTQARRVIQPQPPSVESVRYISGSDYGWMCCNDYGHPQDWRVTGPVWAVAQLGGPTVIQCPYGQVEDHLWLRETFGLGWESGDGSYSALKPTGRDKPDKVFYKADPGWDESDGRHCWRPSIHMPRWASRITLEITDVRVERLQEITQVDALEEGIRVLPFQDRNDPSAWYESEPGKNQARSAVKAFASLWDNINANRGYAWEANPWVWMVKFIRTEDQ